MRYFVEVSYHGQAYHGWQIQQNAHTVQAEIQNAISKIWGKELRIVGSGRTDSGVHARQQFFHVDAPRSIDPTRICQSLNGILPEDIAILNIFKVHATAHARFDAVMRSYEYHICQKKNPFLEDRCYLYYKSLDLQQMNKAGELIVAHNDFRCFSRVQTAVNNFRCSVMESQWDTQNEMLIFYVSANRFLRGMVRAMVGTLIEVGLGKLTLDDFHSILLSGDRKQAGQSVPAKGLFLTRVTYPWTFTNDN